jgi:membrane protease YdiL (CAAX protease family)
MPRDTNPPQQVPRQRIWWALVPALTLPTLSALLYFVIFKEAAVSKPLYVATKVFTILWPVIATVWVLRQRLVLGLHPTSSHLRSLLPGLLIGLAILAVMVTWMKSPWSAVILSGSPEVKAKVTSLGFIDHFVPFAIFITVCHSFIEEFYWRWFVFGSLRRVAPLPAAHAIAAVGFAAHHLVVTSQYYPLWFALPLTFCVATGGLIWSLIFQRCVDAGLMWVGYQMIYPKL